LSHPLTAHSATGQWIFDALVQAANSVAVEPLLSHFQLGRQKKFRWQFLDREAHGVAGNMRRCAADFLRDCRPPPLLKPTPLDRAINVS
jgi:hypothetical protein